jgi:hypothetical protein
MSTVSAKALSERKVKRQKQILAAGSVILLALVGYQLPKALGHGSAATPPASSATAPGASSSPLAAAPGKLPDTDRVAIQADPGQLLSFGLFKSKDPFVQQLSTSPSALPSAPAPPSAGASVPVTTSAPNVPPVAFGQASAPRGTDAAPGSGSTVPAPSATSAAPVTSPAPTPVATAPATTTPAVAAPAPTSVSISTNGACETVAVHGTFPGQDGAFRLVSIAKDGKSAQIGVVGGSFDSGQPAATLKLGEKLTLVNTADGTRYVLVLKAKCEVGTQPANNVPATPAITPAPPAPTTTATTPIVTDALDTTTPTG